MKKNLLLVDDEPNILRALIRLLRRDGYTLFTAASAEEGLELIKQQDFQVIISDQRMPGMCGVEFLSKVKEQQPEIIRIILSGYSDLSSITEAINKGAIFRFLCKPWDDELLRENVKDAFHHYQLYNSFKQREADPETQLAQTILQVLPHAVIAVDDQQRVIYSNPLADAMLNNHQPLQGEILSKLSEAFARLELSIPGQHILEINQQHYQIDTNTIPADTAQSLHIITLTRLPS